MGSRGARDHKVCCRDDLFDRDELGRDPEEDDLDLEDEDEEEDCEDEEE